jgi:hypothetical protein
MKVNSIKTKMATTVAATLIFAFSASAFSYPINLKKKYKDMRKQIIEQITFPRTIATNVGKQKVAVMFSLSETGKLIVHQVQTTNKELVNFVKTNFEQVNVELEKIEPTEVYKMEVEYNLKNQ